MIRFYFDGAKTPAIVVKLNELLSGRLFVKPPFAFVASDERATEGVGGDLYLPIPFAAGCKITLDSLPFYYNINYRAYEPGTKVKTFAPADYEAADAVLKQTAQALNELACTANGKESRKEGRIEPGAELVIDLPAGTGASARSKSRSIRKTPCGSCDRRCWRAALTAEPTVWCPLGEFFGCGARLNPSRIGAGASRRMACSRPVGSCPTGNPAESPSRISESGRPPSNWRRRRERGSGMTVRCTSMPTWRHQYPIETKKADGTMDWNYMELRGQGVYVGDTLDRIQPLARVVWRRRRASLYRRREAAVAHGHRHGGLLRLCLGHGGHFNSPFISMPQRDSASRDDWRGYTTTSRLRLLDGFPGSAR